MYIYKPYDGPRAGLGVGWVRGLKLVWRGIDSGWSLRLRCMRWVFRDWTTFKTAFIVFRRIVKGYCKFCGSPAWARFGQTKFVCTYCFETRDDIS